MKKLFISTAVAALMIGSAGTAMADCTVVDTSFEENLRDNSEMRAAYAGPTIRDLRDLRDAAMVLAAYGQNEACEEVAQSIKQISADPAKANEMSYAYREHQVEGTANAEMAYENAKPLQDTTGRLRADELLGADLHGQNNETVGEISDIVFDSSGSPGYAVVAYGGFLGIGEESSAIPFDMLKVSPNGERFFVSMTEEQIEKAPRFEQGNFDWTEDDAWRDNNDQYFHSTKSQG